MSEMVKSGSVPARVACPFGPQEQTSSGYTAQVRFVPFAIFCTAVYSTLFASGDDGTAALIRANRRGIVRFGDQHYLGGHRSWT